MPKKTTGKFVDVVFNEFIPYGQAKNLSEATINNMGKSVTLVTWLS